MKVDSEMKPIDFNEEVLILLSKSTLITDKGK